MMDSTAWNGHDPGLHTGGDEDFQQFLDLNGMGGLADGLHFDFGEFPATSGPGSHMVPQAMAPPRESIDTPMAGSDHIPAVLSQPSSGIRNDHSNGSSNGSGGGSISGNSNNTSNPNNNGNGAGNGSGNMLSTISTQAVSTHASAAATLMAPPTPTEAIVEIDAQIQYLQQQRMQQQQRQMEEQSAAFFVRHSSMVPPTPQSLELQAGNQFFSPALHHQQHHHTQQHQHQQLSTQSQQNQQQAIYERYQHLKEQQDMAFTPLVSPAVTPLESHFPVDASFTVPGAYFSPLTSPALHAQNDSMSVFDTRLSLTGTSPLDVDLDASCTNPSSGSNSGSGDLAKKARKNNASKTRKANVRQSPITKPQRKKASSTPTMNAQVLDQLAESLEQEVLSSPAIPQQQQQQQRQQQQPLHLLQLTPAAMQLCNSSSSTGVTDSENGSVSPENLTDMPPPPIPKLRSARPSPYLHPQNQNPHSNQSHIQGHTDMETTGVSLSSSIMATTLSGGFPSPATPASLMKLASPQQRSHKPSPDMVASSRGTSGINSMVGSTILSSSSATNDHIESFELPESLSMDFQKSQPHLQLQMTPQSQSQPQPRTMPSPIHTHGPPPLCSPSLDAMAARTSSFQALPSPVFTRPEATNSLTASQSPQLLPSNSSASSTSTPLSTPTMILTRKTPQILPRGAASSKKRASISSVQVSPALRPRISPVIKPLLPGGASAAEDHASRLLATKSNYQNILEGNLVPGVSYPSELSTNLTSKRTSHKIAEQGRRNRINSALQEIAKLLPRQPAKEGGGKGSSDDGEGNGDQQSQANKDDNGGGGGGSNNSNSNSATSGPNSKASTVELAIDYIKQLQQEIADANRRAEEAEEKLRQQQRQQQQEQKQAVTSD